MMKRISYAGIDSGAGTTTQVLQMYKYLAYRGYNCCILMPDKIQFEAYSSDKTYQEIHLVQTKNVVKSDVDILLIDFGSVKDEKFQKDEFQIEKNQALVCTDEVPDDSELKDIFGPSKNFQIVVSFPGEEREDQKNIHYSEVIEDPLKDTDSTVCEELFLAFEKNLTDNNPLSTLKDKKEELSRKAEQRNAEKAAKLEKKEKIRAAKEEKKEQLKIEKEQNRKPAASSGKIRTGSSLGAVLGFIIPVSALSALLIFLKCLPENAGLSFREFAVVIAHFLYLI